MTSEARDRGCFFDESAFCASGYGGRPSSTTYTPKVQPTRSQYRTPAAGKCDCESRETLREGEALYI
ncbi:hypothetical protein MRX96_022796 [Rhipicephalus microplus]